MCGCGAYKYPHRQFSGRCSLRRWVLDYHDPFRRECNDCMNMVDFECQCTNGTEEPSHCPELRDYIRYEGIKLTGRAKELMDRTQRVKR